MHGPAKFTSVNTAAVDAFFVTDLPSKFSALQVSHLKLEKNQKGPFVVSKYKKGMVCFFPTPLDPFLYIVSVLFVHGVEKGTQEKKVCLEICNRYAKFNDPRTRRAHCTLDIWNHIFDKIQISI